MLKVWFDVMAPCDVFILDKLRNVLEEVSWIVTAREHAETITLLDDHRIPFCQVGDHRTSSKLSQLTSVTNRILRLHATLPRFDVSLSIANVVAVAVSRIRRTPSISVVDNDLVDLPSASFLEQLLSWIHAQTDYLFYPVSYRDDLLLQRRGLRNLPLVFDGFKEDLYLADFKPCSLASLNIPFDHYVCVRPEALNSIYLRRSRSIVPELIPVLRDAGWNVVYLPRNSREMAFVSPADVYIPERPIDGPSLAWYSDGVLSGSGTFSREAAILGKPAISFLPATPLGVDQRLIQMGVLFHSRDPYEVLTNLTRNGHPHARAFGESKEILNWVLDQIRHLLMVCGRGTVGKVRMKT